MERENLRLLRKLCYVEDTDDLLSRQLEAQANGNILVEESIEMHKYSYFMRASYLTGECSRGGGSILSSDESQRCIDEGIEKLYEKLPHVVRDHLKTFKRVQHGASGTGEFLTSLQCCLWKSETEWHLAFKGTQLSQRSIGNKLGELWTNTKLFFGIEMDTTIVNECLEIAEAVKKDLDDHNSGRAKQATLTFSGHSLGATISLRVARLYNLRGFHFDPGRNLSVGQERAHGKPESQMVYRTLFDPTSLLFLLDNKPDVTVTTVYNALKQEGARASPFFDSHSTYHFWCEAKNCTSVDNIDSLWVIKESRKKTHDRHKMGGYRFFVRWFTAVTKTPRPFKGNELLDEIEGNIRKIVGAEEENGHKFLRQLQKTCYAVE